MNPTSCPTADWSPVDSAGANSQLSAVLAGFVFAGIVVLLSDRRRESTAVRTLGLFCASFMVLGLSSYLFGLVTGDTEPTACKRAWTETVIASGLLGLGSVALISGIAWLLASYLLAGDGEATDQTLSKSVTGLALQRLGAIVSLMVYGIIGVVTVLLSVTVYGYLRSWYSTPPVWAVWILVLYPPAISLLVLAWKTRRAWKKRHGGARQDVSKGTTDAVFIGAAGSLAYSAIGAIYAGWVASTHVDAWQSPSPVWVYITGAMALLMPAPSLVALAYAAPRLSTGSPESKASSPPQIYRQAGSGRLKASDIDVGATAMAPVKDPAPAPLPHFPTALGMTDIHRRRDVYLTNHYIGLHVTVVSVTLGIAGVTAASLLAAKDLPGAFHLLFGMMWVGSLLAASAAYAGTVTGSFALPAQIPSMRDLMIPVAMAVVEFLLFAVLGSQVTGLPSPKTVLTVWFFCLGLFGLLAVTAIGRARHLFREGLYAPDLLPAVEGYLLRLRIDAGGAAITAGLGFGGGILYLFWSSAPIAPAYGITVVVLLVLAAALIGHGQTASAWRRALAVTTAREAPPRSTEEASNVPATTDGC